MKRRKSLSFQDFKPSGPSHQSFFYPIPGDAGVLGGGEVLNLEILQWDGEERERTVSSEERETEKAKRCTLISFHFPTYIPYYSCLTFLISYLDFFA